jgi:hypothetical protein
LLAILGGDALAVETTIGGQTLELLIDTGSSDTWAVTKNFVCINPASNTSEAEAICDFGTVHDPSHSFVESENEELVSRVIPTPFCCFTVAHKTHSVSNILMAKA